MKYRVRKNSDTVHWVPRCTQYPGLTYEHQWPYKPKGYELCNQCAAKYRRMQHGR